MRFQLHRINLNNSEDLRNGYCRRAALLPKAAHCQSDYTISHKSILSCSRAETSVESILGGGGDNCIQERSSLVTF